MAILGKWNIDDQDRYRVQWVPAETVRGIPYDTPIPGYLTQTVNLLRLWKAESGELCKVLYPVDSELQGKALRLKQQFFLVACALQDAMRLHLNAGGQPETIHERWALQLNDTDPTLAIAELMRLLVDQYGIDWEQAWEVTQRTFAYTNHSLMPEALDDQWTVGVFGHFLPRHLEIIYEVNYRLLETVKAAFLKDDARLSRMSLIDERGERYVRLNYLAAVGSHAVNGISKLHTQLLKQTVFRDFYDLYPDKFSSKTNGISPRRFLLQANPELARLITSKLGNSWIVNLDRLQELEPYAAEPGFCSEWLRIKQGAKQALASQIRQQTDIEVDPNSLFDVQATVIHEYKRQHLNLLHILTLYNRIKANPHLEITPRTFIFAGKAAPDYSTAKLIIKLIHAVADLVNSDADVRGRLRVVFLKDFNIKTAQSIYPAIDLSEHISLAGTEAADIGNMISALNAALIIGTPDGSNIEIREAVGSENLFQFGLTTAAVQQRRAAGYNPMELYYAHTELKRAIDLLTSGELVHGDTELFRPLTNLLLWDDQYMLLADYPSYLACQERVSQTYRDPEEWTRMSILTTARMGRFSSDRAVREYAQEIWNIKLAPVTPSELSGAKESIPAKK
jgi:glycogen phosphorylase